MGQSQSTRNHEDDGESAEGTRTDYYELLRVDSDATGEEIKKAYKRRALELHPDRNYGNTEEATQLFAEVQSAYEVLSDPQERAWYDSHRQVFHGSHGQFEEAGYSYDTRMTTSDDLFQLFTRFSPRMDFNDSPDGFYGGLRDTFARLAAEERAACKWEKTDTVDYPTFGFHNDGFENVVRPFYSVWAGFSTKKSFAWKDVYRYSEAPDRRVRRMMEKENKRLREDGIREFNGAVRAFVAFVRKRDPRYKQNAQSESQRQESLRQSTAAQAARSRAANSAKLRDHVPQDWSKSEYPNEDHSDTPEEDVEHFECIVCHKRFKSQNQVEAHERSKKHLRAVKQLRWEMRAQNEQLDLEEAPYNDYAQPNEAIPGVTAVEPPQSEASYNPSDEVLDAAVNSGPEHIPGVSSEQDTTVATAAESNGTSCSLPASPVNSTVLDEDDYVPREFIESRLDPLKMPASGGCQGNEFDMLSQDLLDCNLEDESRVNGKKPGKAKQRRARKAQRPIEHSGDVKCASCNSTFPSRTQLFAHLKDNLSHAQPPSAVGGPKKGKARFT
ncbi:DnaJ-domain-containing protein [Aspergillus steynii IBT 23096]|uniref:DnaJ-domain-containing protein n=1 Tax=Aspergillus steynii IBT 23096 TaxID=1392250 RepID=A0A2I2GFV4_9EURO|nr:DnaJ-domain-containing protein [Aspergillus steynii IBT 23096]PLB51766.1 DnaJ-domain-containing protein [Aspergillus steynii IBT 23096]